MTKLALRGVWFGAAVAMIACGGTGTGDNPLPSGAASDPIGQSNASPGDPIGPGAGGSQAEGGTGNVGQGGTGGGEGGVGGGEGGVGGGEGGVGGGTGGAGGSGGGGGDCMSVCTGICGVDTASCQQACDTFNPTPDQVTCMAETNCSSSCFTSGTGGSSGVGGGSGGIGGSAGSCSQSGAPCELSTECCSQICEGFCA